MKDSRLAIVVKRKATEFDAPSLTVLLLLCLEHTVCLITDLGQFEALSARDVGHLLRCNVVESRIVLFMLNDQLIVCFLG